MELPDIDWRRVVSRSVRDEAYENIDAPMWVDLAAPDASPAFDDDAWFCRPDCRHPKTAEDFLKPKAPSLQGRLMRSSSEKLPLGERNADPIRDANSLKRRGAIGEGLRSKAGAAGASRNSREDLENQNPNTPTPPRAARPFGGVPKGARNAKAAIKSSAEEKKKEEKAAAEATEEEEEEEEGGERREVLLKRKQQPQLKSTLSARNLFSGKDILSQISEFCSEIKKLAVGVRRRSAAAAAEGEEERVKQERVDSPESTRKDDNGSGKKSKKMVVRVETAKEKGKIGLDEKSPLVLREVRASPPTPQKFPSPSSYRLRHPKAAAGTNSPLKRPPRATQERGGVLEEMEQSKVKKITVATKDEECSSRASAASDSGGSGDSMLWFFKPCTYLVK